MTDRLREGIVRVVGDDGATCGAGFIAAAGLVVTCAHVVVDAGSGPGREVALVRHADGARWRGTVVEEWWGEPEGEDVAVLRVPEAPAEAALLLGALDTAADRQLRTFGFPAAKPVEGLSGRCLVVPGSTTENGHPVHVLESDQVTFGFSGAPVWDDEHEVAVGMVTSIIGVRRVVAGAGDRGRFAVPADPGIRLTRTAFMGPVTTIRARCPELGLPEDVPYLGLDAFEDPRFYFGRDDAVRRLTRTLARERRAVLVGNSGSGKSSLLHAGLAKALTGTSGDLGRRLRCDVVAGTDPLPALVRSLAAGRPASEPRDGRTPGAVTAEGRAALARLAAALGPGCPPDPGPPQEPRPLPPEAVPERLSGMPPGEAAAALSRAVPAGLLVLVDQFERLYAATDERTADHFTDVLLALRDHGAVVVIALRADFYGRALRHAGLADALTRGQVTVLPMTAEELRQAIVEPARLQLRRVQRELADRLIADVRGRPGALPLLELTLKQLWKTEADTGVLSLDGYLALGSGGAAGPGREDGSAEVNPAQGVAGAVYRAAEETWSDKLTDEERDAAPAVFVRLVAAEQIGDASASALTARRAWLGEWDPVARSVVATFVRERLLVLRGDPVSGRPAVEIAHEALIEAWPRLTDWVRHHRAFSDWYAADFAPAFQLWTGHDRREEFLLPKSITEAARAWCVQRPALMAGPALEYVRASAERLDRAQEEAWHARRNADESRSILWATRAVRHDEPTTALALAITAARLEHPSGTALRTLAEVAYRPGLRDELRHGHTAPVLAVTQRAGLLLSAGSDHDVLVWDAAARRVVRTLRGHSGPVRGLALSADASTAVSCSDDRTVIRWDVATGRILGRYEGHQDAVLAVALTPDGLLAVSASADGTALVRDTGTGRVLHRLVGHRDVVAGVAVGGHGEVTATCSADGTVRIWDTATGRPIRTLTGHRGPVRAVAVDEAGRRAASASADRDVRVWDLRTGRAEGPSRPGPGHTASVWSVAFSPDGRRVVSGAADRTVAVWDTDGQRLLHRFEVGRAVNGVGFDDTGETVLCAGDDHSVSAWRTGSGRSLSDLGGHGAPAAALALSGDAGLALVGCTDGALFLWDAADRTPSRLADPGGRRGPVADVMLSRDGRTALALSAAGVLSRHPAGPGAPDPGGRVHPATVVAAALSGDGTTALVATAAGEVCAGPPVGVPQWRRIHRGGATCLAVDTTGTTLLAGDGDGQLHLWTGPGRRHRRLGPHPARVRSVAVSGDGRTALSADDEGTVVLWDLPSGERDEPLEGAGLDVRAVALSDDGSRALLSTRDGATLTWDLPTGEVHHLGGRGRPATAAALSADGRRAWTAAGNAEPGVWDAGRGDVVRVLPTAGGTRALAATRDGRSALTGGEDGAMTLWDLDGGTATARWRGYEDANGLAVSADGGLAVCATDVLPLTVWELRTGEARLLSGHTEAVRCVALTPDGTVAVSGSADHRVILWDVAAGEFVRSLEAHNHTVDAVAVSDDGRLAVSGSQDASSIVWDTGTGAVLRRFGHESAVLAIALGPDARTAAVGTADGTVALCRPDDGSRSVLVGHTAGVRTVAFSPDGRFAVSGDDHGAVLVWDVATGQVVREFGDGAGAVTALACCADASGMAVVSASAGGGIRLRRLHGTAELVAWAYENRRIHRFTCAERSALLIEPGCDPLGNPPPEWGSPRTESGGGPPTVVPLTRSALPPAASARLPARVGGPPRLPPGVRTFDAVQAGRSREWRIDGGGGRATIDVVAGGIDLDPTATLRGPGGEVLAAGRFPEGRRCRVGPVDLPPAGECTLLVEGRRDGPAGGYTLLLTTDPPEA